MNLFVDAKDAVRGLTRNRNRRRYALLAALTLGLGVGGVSAIYGIVQSVILAPLPYGHAGEVGVFWKKTDWTEEEFLFVRGRVPGFQQVTLYRRREITLRRGDGPARLVPGVSASSELFSVLGSRPMLGQEFRPGDDAPDAQPVAVLSYGLWQELGGEPSIIGNTLSIDGVPRTVLGVMPREFWFPDPAVRVWTAESLSPDTRSWDSSLLGRVEPGLHVRAMSGQVARLVAMLGERFAYPPQWDKTVGAGITPLRDDLLGHMRLPLVTTLGASVLILLIACCNVGTLMLGQIDMRARELAVRVAIGATRLRLVQVLLAEAAGIALAAGIIGAAIAWAGFSTLVSALPIGAWTGSVGRGWTMAALSIGMALASVFLVALVVTLTSWQRVPSLRLQPAHRGGRVEDRLVVAQVTLAVLICSVTALLARSMMNLYTIDPGVRTDGVVVVDMMLGGDRLQRVAALAQLRAAFRQQPEIHAAAAVQKLPLRGGGYNLPLAIEGRPDLAGSSSEYRVVTPDYLEVMDFPLLAGRTIQAADDQNAERVVVINEAFARRYFPGEDPLGRRVGRDESAFARVVGVVANAAEQNLRDLPVPVRYVPTAQMPWIDDSQSIVVAVRANVDPIGVLNATRRIAERASGNATLRSVSTMAFVLNGAVGPVRQLLLLLSLITGFALALGGIGVYGVIAHFAANRQREWAVRMALGVTSFSIVTRVVRRGTILVMAGLLLGATAAIVLRSLFASLLHGVSPLDPTAFVVAAIAALTVGVVASLVPAWRAGRTDLSVTLRNF